MFLIKSPVTATTTTPPVTGMCSKASSITRTVLMAPIYVGLAALDQQGVVLPPELITRETMNGSFGLSTVPQ